MAVGFEEGDILYLVCGGGIAGKRSRTANNGSRPELYQHGMVNYPVDFTVLSADFVHDSERMAQVSRLFSWKLQRCRE